MQCYHKNFQYDERDVGSVYSDSKNIFTKRPDTKPVSFTFKCLVSSGITHHHFMHVAILFEMITFTIGYYFLSLKDMLINSSYSTIGRIMVIKSNTSFHDWKLLT